jgi:non-heme chloroperoxidase
LADDIHPGIAMASRRQMLAAATGVAAMLGTPWIADAALKGPLPKTPTKGTDPMTMAVMKDGAKIYYKDWGTGPVVTFSHGWPLTADAWDAQMLFLGMHGYRVIAHDRRSHGRSEQTWNGNDMDTYADDLATLLDTLDVRDATMVGHSTGGGEVARYIGRHGTARVKKAVLISSVPPHMLQTPTNPDAAPMSVFDGLRAGLAGDRPGFFEGFAMPFFGYNRPNAKISQGQIHDFLIQGMMGSIKGQYDCIKALSETDFTDDLKKMTVPTLCLQGDDDQVVPIDIAARKQVKLLPKGSLKVYPGAPHGMCVTHADQVNADLLEFLKS